MYLKRLEIFGFKTFAEKTEILFTHGVTAVVGPNGSGKSNVGDAVLWVMGEQNIRALRGNTSQDVIFAGSDRRKPLGMAEVSLTIDNSARILPLEFAEVTVTRRVYRSGEGEFFINRIPCRLRDIYELFLDTGVGRDAYSFINQSEIDAILSVRAEDRREIFEEAAGIKRYRVRKREALKKLENTRSNLARVNDIIAEIETQLGPLGRQAQVARRHQELFTRLRELELAWYASTLRRLAAESERLGELIEALNAERAHLESQLEAVRADEADRRSQLHALDVELERLRLEEAEQARQVAQAESQMALLGEREESARRQAQALDEEIRELLGRNEELRSRSEAAGAEQDELQAAIRDRQSVRAALQQRVTTLGREVEAAGRKLDARRLHRVELARKQEAARGHVAHLEGRQNSLAASQARLAADRQEWQAERTRIGEDLRETREALQAIESEAAGAEKQRAAHQEEVRRKSAEQNQASTDRDTRAGELTRARARRQALAELAEGFQGYVEGARAVLNASKAGRLPPGYRPLLDALGVPAGLEAATNAALGSAAHAVVAPSREAARQAIEHLRQTESGRATLVFAESELVPLSREAHSGDSARLIDLLDVDEVVQPVVAALIGNVIIVDDLEAAMRGRAGTATPSSPAAERGSDTAPRSLPAFVTRAGEFVGESGAVTGGRDRKSAPGLQAIVSRRREMDELQTAIDDLEAQLSVATRTVECLQKEAAELQDHQASLQAEIDRRAYRREELRRELKRAETETERMVRASARLVEAEAANAREQEEARLALEQALAEAGSSEFDNAALEAEIDAAHRELDERQAAMRALEREAADTRVELAALQEKARSVGANVRRLTESAGSVERQARARRDQAAALAAEREALAKQRQEWSTEAGRRAEQLARLQEVGETRRGERAAQADQLEAAAAHLRDLSDRSHELLQRAHRAEVERTASETERAHLVAQLFSDYELAPDELPNERHPGASPAASQHPNPEPGEIARLRRQLKALGPVNPEAIEEYDRLSERYTFLSGQRDDLEKAQEQISEAIREIDATTRETFMRAFTAIGAAFDEMFRRLFGGGRTELVMTDPSDVLETGIEIIVQPPGKKLQNLLLLSGGERALTASAMLFALLKVRPSPFCVLDEVDAPLDEANVGRFGELLREFAEQSQFIVVTHNRGTMEAADTLYGVTMEELGVSKLVSVRLDDFAEERATREGSDLHFLATR